MEAKEDQLSVLAPGEADDRNLDLVIDDLEDRFAPGVHGACVCSTTCNCTSCSCVAWAS
jgi:hypothetical protein